MKKTLSSEFFQTALAQHMAAAVCLILIDQSPDGFRLVVHTGRYFLFVALETGGCSLVMTLGWTSGSAQHHSIPHHHGFPAAFDCHRQGP